MTTIPNMSKARKKVVYWYIPWGFTIISMPLFSEPGSDSFLNRFIGYLMLAFVLFLFYLIASAVVYLAIDLLIPAGKGIWKKDSN